MWQVTRVVTRCEYESLRMSYVARTLSVPISILVYKLSANMGDMNEKVGGALSVDCEVALIYQFDPGTADHTAFSLHERPLSGFVSEQDPTYVSFSYGTHLQ